MAEVEQVTPRRTFDEIDRAVERAAERGTQVIRDLMAELGIAWNGAEDERWAEQESSCHMTAIGAQLIERGRIAGYYPEDEH